MNSLYRTMFFVPGNAPGKLLKLKYMAPTVLSST